MTNDKTILIKNIYYMLSYAFRVLKQNHYIEIESEEFETVHDLMASILEKGVAQQIKQGLHREYLLRQENLPILKGKVDFNGTIKNQIQRKRLLDCEFDELTENNQLNQIIKTTILSLLTVSFVKLERRNSLKRILPYLDLVDIIEPKSIQWNRLSYQRNNKNYPMLINVCYFILNDMLLTTEEGEYRTMSFSDDHMEKLFEQFVLEYYRYHYKKIKVNASQINWQLDDDVDEKLIRFLPIMQTDITLFTPEKTMIIDTKYYTKTMSSYQETQKMHSNNLYQIFTYVKNYDKDYKGDVEGMLLYAQTDEIIKLNYSYPMRGNTIGARTLDLNQEFKTISSQLDSIVYTRFNEDYDIKE